MKIARLVESNNETYGFVKDGHVSTKDEITFETGVPIPQSIKDFLFDGWYDEVMNKISRLPYKKNLSKFQLLAPIPNPSKIICLAFNYSDHAEEQNLQPPKDPVIIFKPRTTLCGSNSEIICPNFVTRLDYEVELAIVIGKTCKNIDEGEAKNAIFGYMIFNDVSARDIQFSDKQFGRAKSFDTFAPCGPWITTMDEIPDAHKLQLITKINGETRQDSSTSKMFLKIPEIVSKLSKVMTLEKGDIISTGTPSGVVLKNPNLEYLKDGDEIEMEIENLGTLKNTVRFV
ncbi:MAG TPA: FAA hydrolase family protein [Nitrosopumilus sp.]|nr:FAA hydrolase family protein [Nitrosopumilus sp.]